MHEQLASAATHDYFASTSRCLWKQHRPFFSRCGTSEHNKETAPRADEVYEIMLSFFTY
jgi:hypothetical protein